ncbi:hypothetical protein CISIN_1g035288mg [Citrus sinensis]|uniref:Uncharacterized protein n=1 Tax=Citrus sinensis TaxID=2711 RepID=A0A067D969_CITSI|nr:hypothetical protein CISIN_1g035288mg [Citrus sinensis]
MFFFPLFQRMVISLSSDKAVWNAVLNNEAVQELKESFNAVARLAELYYIGKWEQPGTSAASVFACSSF